MFIGDVLFVDLQALARRCVVFAIRGEVQRRSDRAVGLLGSEKKNSDAKFMARRLGLI